MEGNTKQLNNKQKLLSIFRYGNVLVSGRQSTIQSAPEENQVLKYLNRTSTHTDVCFAAIPAGVMKRLASLTTKNDKSELMRIDKMYPAHTKALQTANLAPTIFPTLGKILDNQLMAPTIDDAKGKKDNQDTRTI
jgi:hypothetical protein